MFTFRHFTDTDDFDTWTDECAKFLTMAKGKAALGDLRPLLPKRDRTIIEAHLLSYLSVTPKLSHKDVLRLTKVSEAFKKLVAGVEKARAEFESKELETQVEQKKGRSKQTRPAAPSSESAATT